MPSSKVQSRAEEQSRPPAAPSADGRGVPPVIAMPGHEFPTSVYVSIMGAFAWMLVTAWLAFSASDGTNLDLGMVTVLAVMFFGIPLAMHRTSVRNANVAPTPMRQFMSTSFDTYTGAMPARQAWMEVLLIPVALAVAATAFGIVYWLVG